jgi:hypothetical protein
LSAPFLYVSIFIGFPDLRDRPWPTFLIFGIGFALMALGLRRAYLEPAIYRGRMGGTILAAVGFLVLALYGAGVFHFARQVPPSRDAPKVGEKAPDFTLQDKDGRPVTLSRILATGPDGRGGMNGAVLIFYRGFW